MKQKEIIEILDNDGYIIKENNMAFNGKLFVYEKDSKDFVDVINKKQLESLLEKDLIKIETIDESELLSGVYTFSSKKTKYIKK